VITLLPETYNKRYQELKLKGRNLNDLLAWMHARIIVDLHNQFVPQGVIIDKFTTDGRLRAALKDMENIRFINRTKAEDDPFVAAASIIARFHFNNWFARLKKEQELDIPRGAGPKVDKAAEELVEKLGINQMNRYVKLHFSNYNKLI
jgi:ribonuclease HIII